jgi:broad specificity phosphatase PhoE
MSEIFLIRHGQASFGQDNYDQLSPVGVRQAKIVARYLSKVAKPFDAVYSGKMKRQVKTAEELIENYRVKQVAVPQILPSMSFNEYDSLAVWESLIPGIIQENPSLSKDLEQVYTDKKSFQILFEQVMDRWISGAYDLPGSPKWSDFKKRVRQGLKDIMRRHSSKMQLAIFTSGGPISVAIQLALGISDKKTMEISWQIMNASITRFKYNDRGFALSGFNDIAHLELEQDEQLLTYR